MSRAFVLAAKKATSFKRMMSMSGKRNYYGDNAFAR